MTTHPNPKVLDYLVNHITLPPELPHSSDDDFTAGSTALVHKLIHAARTFRSNVDAKYYETWSDIIGMLDSYNTLHASDSYNSVSLMTALNGLKTVYSPLVLYLNPQNATLFIRKEEEDYFVEASEASPLAADVLACSRLIWRFPGRTVTMPATTFESTTFQDSFVEFLSQASDQEIKDFQAVSGKAGSAAFESRDTGHPALISDLLMALLEANGTLHAAPITSKHVRDEVLWSDGAERPWRRCPEWLVLCVALQRTLSLVLGGASGLFMYKLFIAFVNGTLCDDALHTATPDRLSHMGAKLARKLTKLEMTMETTTTTAEDAELFSRFREGFENTLSDARNALEQTWNAIQQSSLKQIPILPTHARPQDMQLSLTHSNAYLSAIIKPMSYSDVRTTAPDLQYYTRKQPHQLCLGQPNNASELFTYLDLAAFEDAVATGSYAVDILKPQERARMLRNVIFDYIECGKGAYRENVDQLSAMAVCVMELWVQIDKIAIEAMPLLADHPVPFPDDLMHNVRAPTERDLERILEIETYLSARHGATVTGLPSVFAEPMHNCFAERVFDQDSSLQAVLVQLEALETQLRSRKSEEFAAKKAVYEDLIRRKASMDCAFTTDRDGDLVHNDKRCKKCYLGRCARRVKIAVHEHILPQSNVVAKTVVFELKLQPIFAAWRDATWFILSALTRKPHGAEVAPCEMLHTYAPLKAFHHRETATVVLASRTKSFLSTHYSSLPLSGASLNKVLLGHGLNYSLYDSKGSLWTAHHIGKPSLAELCRPVLHGPSPFVSLGTALHPVDGVILKTSNEAMAWQTHCPNGMTILEGQSYLELRLTGHKLQWPRLLRELASTNLNFSLEAVTTLVTQLALQAGPSQCGDVLRQAHWIFKDEAFCEALLSQLHRRIDACKSNWREAVALDCYVTLILRCFSLTTAPVCRQAAKKLLLEVRAISVSWTRALRQEILKAPDATIAKRRSLDALSAALLCRHTFAIEAQSKTALLAGDDIAVFLELSILLKQNLPNKMIDMSKQSNWIVNLGTREALRRETRLVDPGSSLFHTIASVVAPFENRRSIVVFQPEKASLRVNLPVLELEFNVAPSGLLESYQLRAVIDRDQDAGCLYGLRSKLVIHDIRNPQERAVLATFGEPEVRRRGSHVDGK